MLALLTLLWLARLQGDAPQQPSSVDMKDGQAVYRAACAACHGSDGKGQPRQIVGFDTTLPDFTDCSFATPEPNADWIAIVHQGGPVRAFDRRMPAFGEALSERQIQQTIDYIRSFCRGRSWPPGELNLPRALVTEKAFPENEAVITTTILRGEEPVVTNEFLYERRIGARSQFELSVPLTFQQDPASAWHRGLGDVSLAVKHAAFHRGTSGTIVSVAAEIVFPTGKENEGLGGGVTVFEPFVTVGQVLPSDGFIQFQGGLELPTKRTLADNDVFWRAAIGKTFAQGRFGRSWSPMLEVLAARELGGDEPVEWDMVPQLQVTLSKRQHITINAGVRFPLTNRRDRDVQVLTYFLWDWFDGGLFDGWR